MRLTGRKKEILSYFEPDNRELVTREIEAPLLDVSGVAYLTTTNKITASVQASSTDRAVLPS
ncbi:hypothetical protein ACU0IO_002140 [Serratia marcescens]